MITVKQCVEACFVIVVGTALAVFVTIQRGNTTNRSLISSAAAPIAQIPLPTEAPAGPTVSVMDSPEGSETLTLEKQGMVYSLFVTAKPDGQKVQIFTKEEPNSQTLEIPFNTWSVENNYVFLKEKTPSQMNYLVFQSNGSVFSNNSVSISVQEHFKEKVPNYEIEDVTGWAGNTSLIVNAKEVGGERKLSFWFEVPSQSFIQLGTYFK